MAYFDDQGNFYGDDNSGSGGGYTNFGGSNFWNGSMGNSDWTPDTSYLNDNTSNLGDETGGDVPQIYPPSWDYAMNDTPAQWFNPDAVDFPRAYPPPASSWSLLWHNNIAVPKTVDPSFGQGYGNSDWDFPGADTPNYYSGLGSSDWTDGYPGSFLPGFGTTTYHNDGQYAYNAGYGGQVGYPGSGIPDYNPEGYNW